jgi:hypothetical protein
MAKYRAFTNDLSSEAVGELISLSGARLVELPDGLPHLRIEPRVGNGIQVENENINAFGHTGIQASKISIKLAAGGGLSFNGSGELQATGTGTSVTLTDDTTTNATRYLLFEDTTSGTVSTVNVASTKLTFNPSTGVLAASGGFSGNANTATTLQTARTLWGQSFNGSANVTGNLTSVGNITGTGAVTLTATGSTLGLAATGASAVQFYTNGSLRAQFLSTGDLQADVWTKIYSPSGSTGVLNLRDGAGTVDAREWSFRISSGALDLRSVADANTTQTTVISFARAGGITVGTGPVTVLAAATQDAVRLQGRAGGTGSFIVTLTPTTLTASRTVTLADGNTTLVAGTMVPTTRTLTIANGTGITGGGAAVDLSADRSWTIGLTGQALAFHNLASNGLVARTAANTVAARTITGTAGQITVTNGDGVAGNPTLSLPADVDITTTLDVGSVGAITAAMVRVGGDIRASGTIYANDFVLTGGAGSGTGLVLDSLDDVITTGANAPTDQQVLTFDVAAGNKWIPKTVSGGSGTTVTISDDTTTNGNRYLSFVAATSGTASTLNVASTKLTFNPSTGTLNATVFSGSGASLTSLNASNVSSGTLALGRGGTGATTQAGAANAILPSQTSQSGKFLTTDGTNVSWATVSGGSGTITIGSTAISLGGTATTITGLTSLTSTTLATNTLNVNGLQTLNTIGAVASSGIVNAIWGMLQVAGRRLFTDEQFSSGVNGISVYNNNGGSAVTHSRKSSSFLDGHTQVPNGSGFVIEITHAPGTSLGISPNFGGWHFAVTPGGSNRRLLCVFKMKVPSGRTVEFATNSLGTGGLSQWLTSNAGTGSYQDYALIVHTGASPSSTHFYSVAGGTSTTFYTYLASATVYDVTDVSNDVFQTVTARTAPTQDAVILAGRAGGTSSFGVTISPTTLTANRTVTLADGNTTLVTGTMVPTTTSITINGTTNQITSSAGSQDLSANRTWTLSLPQNIHTGATPTFAGLTLSGSASVTGTVTAIAAATQDAVRLQGRAGGTGSFIVTLTPTTLTASRTVTLANGDTTLVAGTMVPTTTSVTINGTTNQITSSAGAQDLSANRTWTLSLPQNIHTAATPTFASIILGTDPGGSNLVRAASARITSLGVGRDSSGTAGRIDASNDIVAYSSSDLRLKTDVVPLTGALSLVEQLSAIRFTWRQDPELKLHHGYDERPDIGLVAQEVEEVFPELVQERESGFKAVRYERMIPVLLQAIKELHQEVQALRQERA